MLSIILTLLFNSYDLIFNYFSCTVSSPLCTTSALVFDYALDWTNSLLKTRFVPDKLLLFGYNKIILYGH